MYKHEWGVGGLGFFTTAWYTNTVFVLSLCHQGQITKVLNMKPPEVGKLCKFVFFFLSELI